VREINRRGLLRLGVLGAALVGSTVGTHRLAAGEPRRMDTILVDELYKGRRIRAYLPATGIRPQVYIDDGELHMMRLPSGRYTTVMNHYQSFGTPLQAARAAVDNLRGAALLPLR
jgi:hypothetical protein